MRETSHFERKVKTKDYAVYTLFVKSAPSVGAPNDDVTLNEYLSMVASYRNPPFIGVTIEQYFGQLEKFYDHFQRQNQQDSPTFDRAREKLILSGRGRDWTLAVVEIEPAELRFHHVSNAQWRKHRTEIEKYRSAHPEGAAQMTNEAIAAALNLAPYHEVLAFHSPDPVLGTQNATFEFRVPRDDGTGHDTYVVKINAFNIVIIEAVGVTQQQTIFSNTVDPADYLAKVINIQ